MYFRIMLIIVLQHIMHFSMIGLAEAAPKEWRDGIGNIIPKPSSCGSSSLGISADSNVLNGMFSSRWNLLSIYDTSSGALTRHSASSLSIGLFFLLCGLVLMTCCICCIIGLCRKAAGKAWGACCSGCCRGCTNLCRTPTQTTLVEDQEEVTELSVSMLPPKQPSRTCHTPQDIVAVQDIIEIQDENAVSNISPRVTCTRFI